MHGGKMEDDLRMDLMLRKESSSIDCSPNASKIKQLQQLVAETRVRNSSLKRSVSKDLSSINSKESSELKGVRSSEIVSTKKLNSKLEHSRNMSFDLNLLSKIIPASHDDDKWLAEYKIKLPMKKGPQRGE